MKTIQIIWTHTAPRFWAVPAEEFLFSVTLPEKIWYFSHKASAEPFWRKYSPKKLFQLYDCPRVTEAQVREVNHNLWKSGSAEEDVDGLNQEKYMIVDGLMANVTSIFRRNLAWMRLDCDAGSKVKAGTNCGHPIHHCMLTVQNHLQIFVVGKVWQFGWRLFFKTLLGAEAVRARKSAAILTTGPPQPPHSETVKDGLWELDKCLPNSTFCHVSKINNFLTRTRIILYHLHESFPGKYSVSSFFLNLFFQCNLCFVG